MSPALTRGGTYEVEGALADSAGRARALAVVQDLARVSLQLTAPISPEVLYERVAPPVRCLRLLEVPVLQAVGVEAEERLGLARTSECSPMPLIEQTEAWRRAVRGLRADGWTGAIALPGFEIGARILVIPRAYLLRGQVRIENWNDGLQGPVPLPLVDFSLGRISEFPSAADIGGLPVIRMHQKVVTRSWRPVSSNIG